MLALFLYSTAESGSGSPIQSIPEIIKAAGTDTYSLLAFCILIVGYIAFVYFGKGTPAWIKLLVFVLLFVGCGAFAIAVTKSAQQLNYVGQIVDSDTGRPVKNAKVDLEIKKNTMTDHSDSEGIYAFWMKVKDTDVDGRLKIDASNYPSYDRHVHVSPYTGLVQVRLTAIKPTVVNFVLKPLPKPGVPRPEELKVEKSSGLKASGVGSEFSDWYELCSGPAPQDYSYRDSKYWLTGDRECGKWAECRYGRADDSNVCFEFRLQGHNEGPGQGQGLSEGHLLVTYKSGRQGK